MRNFLKKNSLRPDVWQEIDTLRARLDELSQRASYEHINEATRTLGAKALKENPNLNYIGNRFKDYDTLMLNVKQMGYYIGRKEAEGIDANARLKAPIPLSKEQIKSKLCTQDDCESNWYFSWLQQLNSGFIYHRKLWEFTYIAQNLYALGALEAGKRGLGFGCGEEPLPSLFAKFGASVVATDLDPRESEEQGHGWMEAGAHSTSLEKLLKRDICPDERLLANIKHEFANMNRIPEHFVGQFDFCWSSCALEHLGSIELGLRFIENSVETLRPGGVAVHTTEFNLSDGETIDNWPTVLFQKKHLEELQVRLSKRGFIMSELDFKGGNRVLDGLFDIPPWPWEAEDLNWDMLEAVTHLKKSIDGFPCTSVGVTVVRP
jgi:2-polyprenyl-3-methyl-5-hydroxy-6-metoxy-1,4-benzoquinol methylase